MTKNSSYSKILLYKKKLRKEILDRLKSQDKTEVLRKSLVIKKRLFENKEFKKARCVVFFVSMEKEVDTHQMIDEGIRMGKIVGVPVVFKGKKDLVISQITNRIKQLEIGPYGIRQPKAEEIRPISFKDIELVLVPAVAFDRNGNRLGRGKGYYDRFLKKISKHALTIGLCFDFQIVESIPTLAHDIPVQMFISNA